MLAADVVEEPVERLADDGQRPRIVIGRTRSDRTADNADAERVCDPDRRRQQSGLAHPLEPGQLAVSVQAVTPGEEGRCRRADHRHAGGKGRALDQAGVAESGPGGGSYAGTWTRSGIHG